VLYRIFTEHKNLRGIVNILDRLFNGYTIFYVDGVWQGCQEQSLCIEISSENQEGYLDLRVRQAADEIRILNVQEAVLIQKIPCETVLIGGC